MLRRRLTGWRARSGLNTEIGLLDRPVLWIGAGAIVLAAILGKGLACATAARISGESTRDSYAIGWLMNARGLMELIILDIGLEAGVITPTLFTMMVLMAIVTTLMASPLFVYARYGRWGWNMSEAAGESEPRSAPASSA